MKNMGEFNMKQQSFLKGAVILGVAGFLVQIMGAFFRIPLGNIIGDEGMGYYQTAYPIYVFLLVFSTNGAPAAISKMTSERLAVGANGEAHRVFKLSFILMLILGILASSAVFIFSKQIVDALNNPKALYAMQAIAPALLFVPILAVFRGYFQGMQNMAPTAISQLIEQASRVIAGVSLAIILLPKGIEYSAAGATLGTTIGPVIGMISLIFMYLFVRKNLPHRKSLGDFEKENPISILKELAVISVPITVGVSILPIMNIADVVLVIGRLKELGIDSNVANGLYGQLTGMAGPVINIPMALALSMALSVVPAIAAAIVKKDKETLDNNIKLGLRTSMIIGVPCSFGLMSLAEPIMKLLFPLQIDSAVNASISLFYMSSGVIFLCVAQTMAGILQGMGKPAITVWGLFIAFIVKYLSSYILMGMFGLNVIGAAIGSALGFFTVGLFNFMFVKKYTDIRFDWNLSLIRPILAGLIMTVVILVAYKVLNNWIGNSLATIGSAMIGGITYVVALIKTESVTEDELVLFPKGEALSKILKKVKLI